MDNINNISRDKQIIGSAYPHESWKEMFQHLYSDLAVLYERQSLLIRSEMKEKIERTKAAAVLFAVGGAVIIMGLFAATATAIIALNGVLPLWASSLTVTSVMLIVGGVMVIRAKKKFTQDTLLPHQSLEAVNEIKTTFKERIDEFKHH